MSNSPEPNRQQQGEEEEDFEVSEVRDNNNNNSHANNSTSVLIGPREQLVALRKNLPTHAEILRVCEQFPEDGERLAAYVAEVEKKILDLERARKEHERAEDRERRRIAFETARELEKRKINETEERYWSKEDAVRRNQKEASRERERNRTEKMLLEATAQEQMKQYRRRKQQEYEQEANHRVEHWTEMIQHAKETRTKIQMMMKLRMETEHREWQKRVEQSRLRKDEKLRNRASEISERNERLSNMAQHKHELAIQSRMRRETGKDEKTNMIRAAVRRSEAQAMASVLSKIEDSEYRHDQIVEEQKARRAARITALKRDRELHIRLAKKRQNEMASRQEEKRSEFNEKMKRDFARHLAHHSSVRSEIEQRIHETNERRHRAHHVVQENRKSELEEAARKVVARSAKVGTAVGVDIQPTGNSSILEEELQRASENSTFRLNWDKRTSRQRTHVDSNNNSQQRQHEEDDEETNNRKKPMILRGQHYNPRLASPSAAGGGGGGDNNVPKGIELEFQPKSMKQLRDEERAQKRKELAAKKKKEREEKAQLERTARETILQEEGESREKILELRNNEQKKQQKEEEEKQEAEKKKKKEEEEEQEAEKKKKKEEEEEQEAEKKRKEEEEEKQEAAEKKRKKEQEEEEKKKEEEKKREEETAAHIVSSISPAGRGFRAVFVACSYKQQQQQQKESIVVNEISQASSSLATTLATVQNCVSDFSQRLVLVDDTQFMGRTAAPEKDAILSALDYLVTDSRPGDSLLFYFIGHDQLPSQQQQQEEEAKKEEGEEQKQKEQEQQRVLVPIDFESAGTISLDLIRAKLSSVPRGVHCTLISETTSGLPLVVETGFANWKWVPEENEFILPSTSSSEGSGGDLVPINLDLVSFSMCPFSSTSSSSSSSSSSLSHFMSAAFSSSSSSSAGGGGEKMKLLDFAQRMMNAAEKEKADFIINCNFLPARKSTNFSFTNTFEKLQEEAKKPAEDTVPVAATSNKNEEEEEL